MAWTLQWCKSETYEEKIVRLASVKKKTDSRNDGRKKESAHAKGRQTRATKKRTGGTSDAMVLSAPPSSSVYGNRRRSSITYVRRRDKFHRKSSSSPFWEDRVFCNRKHSELCTRLQACEYKVLCNTSRRLVLPPLYGFSEEGLQFTVLLEYFLLYRTKIEGGKKWCPDRRQAKQCPYWRRKSLLQSWNTYCAKETTPVLAAYVMNHGNKSMLQVHDANATKCAILSSRDKSLTMRDTERQEPCEESFNHKAQKGQNKLSKPANM